MAANIYAPTAQDDLSAEELALYHLIMDYRAANGLAAVPLSTGLTATAGRHALDTVENIWRPGLTLPDGTNLHSWSDAPYFGDHRAPQVMWQAPQRLGNLYPGNGYEVSAAGYGTVAAALAGWQASPGHNQVILNLGSWAAIDWTSIGIGVDLDSGVGPFGGRIYHVWFGAEADPRGGPDILGTARADRMEGTQFADRLLGLAGNDTLTADAGHDTLRGGDGADVLNGGAGDDFIFGGDTAADLRDVVYGGDGADNIDGGHGNDEIYGGAGFDTLEGGFGADTLYGQDGHDTLSGSALGDLLFGGTGNDFLNGGFGSDRMNGGAGADRFFHAGVAGHGSDWIQDFAAGDRLVTGLAGARPGQFQVNTTITPGAGADSVAEAFVIYRPTGQILWALVDGAAQGSIDLQIGNDVFALMV